MSEKKRITPKQAAEILASRVAAKLHERWRKEYSANKNNIDENGKVKPRWKNAEADRDFIRDRYTDRASYELELPHFIVRGEKIGMEKQSYDFFIDINVPYHELTPKFREENFQAGLVVANIVLFNDKNKAYKDVGNIIHTKWLERNQWAYQDRPDLTVEFDKLPLDEKKKDLVQYELALEELKLMKKDLKKEMKQVKEDVKEMQNKPEVPESPVR